MKRPSRRDPEVIALVVERLLPQCKAWILSGNGDFDEAGVKDDLKDVLSRSWEWDGFKLARDLDWDADMELAEIMDSVAHYAYQKVNELEKEYAKTLTPKLKIGDQVQIPGKDGNGMVSGEVTKIQDTGHYYVFSEALGHVRPDTKGGTLASIFSWEVLDKINAKEEECNEAQP